MNRERVKLIVKNMQLLIDALKEEINESHISSTDEILYEDYDEIYEGE